MPLPHMRKGQPFVPSVHIDSVLPPHNIEAEQSTIGSMLIEEPAALKGLHILEADDFYRAAHQTLFTAIEHLARRGQPADFITVGEHLKSKGQLESVGGTAERFMFRFKNWVYTSSSAQAPETQARAICRVTIRSRCSMPSRSIKWHSK